MGSFLLFASFQHLPSPYEFPILVCLEIRSRQSMLYGKRVIRNVNLPNTVAFERFREFHVEVNGIAYFALAVSPTAAGRRTTHPCLDRSIPHYFHILARRSAPDTTRQIQLNARCICLRVAEPEHTRARSSRDFCPDAVALQRYSIVVCFRALVCMTIS